MSKRHVAALWFKARSFIVCHQINECGDNKLFCLKNRWYKLISQPQTLLVTHDTFYLVHYFVAIMQYLL